MRGSFRVIVALCAQCPSGTEPQRVAHYPNGLNLCETHDTDVRANHRAVYEKHPLAREREYDDA